MAGSYSPPAFTGSERTLRENAVAAFVATIAVILVFFATTWAWCYFMCRSHGGVRSCEVGWFTAKAICRR